MKRLIFTLFFALAISLAGGQTFTNNLSVNGTTQFGVFGSNVLNGASVFTIEFWVKTTSTASNSTYWQKPTLVGIATNGNASNDLGITTSNGYIGFWHGLNGEQSYESSTVQVNDNNWHHIAVSNNGTTITLYVDGVSLQSLPSGNPLVTTNAPLTVGGTSLDFGYSGNNAANVNFFHQAQFAEMRISNVARYASNFTPATSFTTDASTVALQHFSGQCGLKAIDASANQNDLLVNNATASCTALPFGNDLVGNGVSKYAVTTPGLLNNLSTFTIEGWIKSTDLGVTPNGELWRAPNIVGNASNGNYSGDFIVSTQAGYICLYTGLNTNTGDNAFISRAFICDGQWHHWAVTANGTTAVLFADGINVGSLPINRALATSGNNAFGLMVNHSSDLGGNFYPHAGEIDEVRFSTNVRYTTNFAPPTGTFSTDANTAALYHLEGFNCLNFYTPDASGNNDSAQIYGYAGCQPDPLYSAAVAASGNITKAEYFLDSDPGFGNGVNIPLTAAQNISALAATISTGSLSTGIHKLYVRTLSATGNWSLTNERDFLIDYNPAYGTSPAAAGNVVKAEYFIDTDPGFGGGVNIPMSAALDIANLAVTVNTTSLATGIHKLYLRTLSAGGNWSITIERDFLIDYNPPYGTSPAAAGNVVKAEYFVDTDPGFGNAVNVPLTAAINISNLAVNVATATLIPGVHKLYLRTLSASGNWSITNEKDFLIDIDPAYPAAPAAAGNVVKAEYFFDTDPGFGNATNLPITPAANISGLATSVATGALSAGNHRLYIRTLNATGNWSITNDSSFLLTASLSATIVVTPNPGSTICSGTSVTFNASITNGGTAPAYQWKKNNINVGLNQNSYTDNALNNGDVITCQLTSNDPNASPAVVTSSPITMVVNQTVTPTITTTATPGNTICAGTAVTFNATITNGGTTPVYQWEKDGNPVGQNQNSYSDNGLTNGNVITCQLTSNATCASATNVTSSGIAMTVNANVTPTIGITSNAGTGICAGTSVTFNATISNGGAAPVYQWKKNGNPVGQNQNFYTDNGLANNDNVTCVITSNAACVITNTATSNSLAISVTAPVTPTVSILANPGNTICSGTPVTFNATISNGGTAPVYQWKKNNINVGQNQSSYADNGLANGDVVLCQLTSNAGCTTSPNATSSSISMTVNPTVTPTISIMANPGTTICAGTSVTFNASAANGGNSPVYQWKKNGNNVSSNQNFYTDNALANADAVTCVLTSNAGCTTAANVTSNSISIAVSQPVTINTPPAASVSICAGQTISLSVTATNGTGYQWQKNSTNINGATNASYTLGSAATTDGGTYNVVIAAGAGCSNASASSSVTVNALSSSLATTGTSQTFIQMGGTSFNYTDNNCGLVSSITTPSGSNLGSTSAGVTISNTLTGFVKRYYTITPATSMPATVKLYFLQSEFNNYNDAAGPGQPHLPANPTDGAVSDISIHQYHGGPGGGTTGPFNNYNASNLQTINGNTVTKVWNGAYWEISFPVTGFSDFFLLAETATSLPITLTDISAQNEGSYNRVNWSTAHEDAGDYFELERSINGMDFVKIATIASNNKASVYAFDDKNAFTGINYYRLKMVEQSGRYMQSKTVTATVKSSEFNVSVYPNPAHLWLSVQVSGADYASGKLQVLDMRGSVILRKDFNQKDGFVDISALAQGAYFVRFSDDEHSKVIRFVKD